MTGDDKKIPIIDHINLIGKGDMKRNELTQETIDKIIKNGQAFMEKKKEDFIKRMHTHECYVSVEVAKLLKESGFNWDCFTYYDRSADYKFYFTYPLCEHSDNPNYFNDCISAPTLAIAQKWIRDTTDYQVEAICVYKEHKKKYSYAVYLGEYNNEILEEDFNSYELALEAGIKKCLEIILTKQQ